MMRYSDFYLKILIRFGDEFKKSQPIDISFLSKRREEGYGPSITIIKINFEIILDNAMVYQIADAALGLQTTKYGRFRYLVKRNRAMILCLWQSVVRNNCLSNWT